MLRETMGSTATIAMAVVSVTSFALLFLSLPSKSHGLYRVVPIPNAVVPIANTVRTVPSHNEVDRDTRGGRPA